MAVATDRGAGIPSSRSPLAVGHQNPEFDNRHTRVHTRTGGNSVPATTVQKRCMICGCVIRSFLPH